MMEAILALLFGLLIGSFLNVCIYRWPLDLSVVKPRSHCIACGKTIAWYDNIPLVSFVVLGGQCRYCHARIRFRYPVVELATGLLFCALSVAASRILLGMHFLSDVLAGAAIGSVVACASVWAVRLVA